MASKRKAKKKATALALIPHEEPTLQVLAREFDEFIRGVQQQEQQGTFVTPAGVPLEHQEQVSALAKAVISDSIQKRDKLAELLRRMESEEGYLREQGKQRYDAAKHIEHLREKILFCLKLYFEMEGIKEVQGFAYRFKLQKNPASVFILDEQAIPEEYMNFKPTPDKEKIKEALQAGKEVPGCTLRVDSNRLEVK